MLSGEVNPLVDSTEFDKRISEIDIESSLDRPQLYCESTFWQPAQMTKIEDFCDRIDFDRPDFLATMKSAGQVNANVTDIAQLTKDEREIYDGLLNSYISSYCAIFPSVFAKNIKYKQPTTFNSAFKDISSKDCQLWCYAFFLKPGRFQYMIRTNSKVNHILVTDFI